MPTQIASTRQCGDETQQSTFLHSVAFKVVKFATDFRRSEWKQRTLFVLSQKKSSVSKRCFCRKKRNNRSLEAARVVRRGSLISGCALYVWKRWHLIYFVLKVFHSSNSPFTLFQWRKLLSAVIWVSYPVLNNVLGFCWTAAHTQVHIYSEECTRSVCRDGKTDSKAVRVSVCLVTTVIIGDFRNRGTKKVVSKLCLLSTVSLHGNVLNTVHSVH